MWAKRGVRVASTSSCPCDESLISNDRQNLSQGNSGGENINVASYFLAARTKWEQTSADGAVKGDSSHFSSVNPFSAAERILTK